MGENNHILVVDDDNRIRGLIKEYLGDNDFIVSTASNADEAKKKLGFSKFNLLVLDVMMPGQDGYSLVKELKEKICPPIILLTAKGEVENRVKGLELGADDYIVKPFSIREFMLRVSAMLKRTDNKSDADEDLITFDSLEIDLAAHRVKLDDKEISLTAKEFALLQYLTERMGRVQTRDALLDEVWGYNSEVTTRTVDTHVKRLRSKLKHVGSNIETVRGVGYRFNSPS